MGCRDRASRRCAMTGGRQRGEAAYPVRGGPALGEIVVRVKAFGSDNAGLAFFLAWSYMTVFTSSVYTGEGDPFGIERLWAVSAAVQIAVALVGLALARMGKLRPSRAFGVGAVATAVIGNVALWLSFKSPQLYWALLPVGGVSIGISMTLFSVIWGARLARCTFSQIEFDVLGSFAIAFALYCVTLPMKLYGIPQLIIATILPIVSAWLAYRRSPAAEPFADQQAAQALGRSQLRDELRGTGSTLAMVAALWVIAAFLRVIYTPYGAADTFMHYFAPFFLACIASVALFGALVWLARHVSVTLAFRWAIPFFLASLAAVSFNPFGVEAYSAAYTLNYLGMFGVQVSLWMAMAKFSHNKPGAAARVFLGYAAASGLGIVIGCVLGLVAWEQFSGTQRLAAALAVLSACAFLALLLGFSPRWRTPAPVRRVMRSAAAGVRAQELSEAGGGVERVEASGAAKGGAGAAESADAAGSGQATGQALPHISDEDMIALLMRNKARALQQEFGLTARETEVAELLLTGRSRPYIRDTLMISLNTVHTHASNIFSKCGVHSQQELIDLARGN